MKRYQAVAFLLSTAMTVSSVAPVFGASNDVFGHWAELTITKWQNEGRIGGYEDGTFKPDKAITRAEFVRLLNSAAPTAFTSSASINFSDVKESDWFYADVAKAVGGRVASGFEDGTFRPGETVTRMQAAVFICNAKGLTPNEAAANNFTDAAQIPAWAKGAVGAAVAAGYLSGYPDGSFGGSKGMTRAEAVSTLDRVLGGGSTTTTPSGEIDTSDRDKDAEKEDNRTAEAGNMVWTSGGSGGGSSKKSSSSSNSSSSDKKTNNVTIRSQKDADGYEGKTLTGTTEIYVDGSGIDLQDIKFKGDVEIYADDTVAAAYIGKDTAVAAASSTVDIYFEGKTNVTGKITVIRNNVAGADQVVIRTRTPRALSASVLAKVATKIVGFEINRVEATAPVEIAEGAKVNTVEAGDNATVEVAADASVDKVNVTGDAKDIVLKGEGSTDVTVKSGASADQIVVDSTEATVELEGSAKVNDVFVVGDATAAVKVNDNAKVDNVAVSDSASADVAVADKAAVNKVELSDTATAKVDVAPDAKVDTITSTSTGKTEVSGEGTVDKIEATDPSTVDTSNAGDNVANVDKKEEENTTPATTTITAAQLKDVTLATPETGKAASVKGLPTGVKQSGTNWTAESTATPAADEPTGGGTGSGGTGSGGTGSGGTGSGGTGSGGTGTTTPTTKKHTATITLTADTGYAFDTTIKTADLTGLADAIEGEATVTATEIKFNVTADIAATDPEGPDLPEETEKVPKSVTISDVGSELNHKTTTTFTATVKDTNGADMVAADYNSIKWELLDEKDEALTNDKISIGETTGVLTVGELTEDVKVKVKVTVTGKDKNATQVTNTTNAITIKAEDPTITGIKLVAPSGFPTEAVEEQKEITFATTDVKGVAGSSTVDLPANVTPAFEVSVVNKTEGANDAAITGEDAKKYAEFDSATNKLTVKAIADDDAVKQVEISIVAKATINANEVTSEPLTITARQAAVATAVKITTPAAGTTISVEQGATYETAFAAKCVDQYGEDIDTPTGQNITFEVSKERGQVVQGTAIGNGNKLTVAKTEPEGKLIVTAKCSDLTVDTREVTVTKAGSDNPSGGAGFDDENNANTEIQLTSANLTAGENITLATKGITNITGTITSQFTGYKKADDSTDSTVDGSKLDVTATVDKTSVKVTAKQKGNEAPVAGTYTYEIEIPAGGATIDDKGATNNAAIKTNITVVVEDDNGGGSKTISSIADITLDDTYIPVGGKAVPTTAQTVTGTGYTATVEYKTDSNNFATVDTANYFKPSTQYTVTVTVTPDTSGGYSFANNFSNKVKVKLGADDAGTEVDLADGTSDAKTGTLTVTSDEASAEITSSPLSFAKDTELSSNTEGNELTITLTNDAFNANISPDTPIDNILEIGTLPTGITGAKVKSDVTAGAKSITIYFEGTPSEVKNNTSITCKVKAAALIGGANVEAGTFDIDVAATGN